MKNWFWFVFCISGTSSSVCNDLKHKQWNNDFFMNFSLNCTLVHRQRLLTDFIKADLQFSHDNSQQNIGARIFCSL